MLTVVKAYIAKSNGVTTVCGRFEKHLMTRFAAEVAMVQNIRLSTQAQSAIHALAMPGVEQGHVNSVN